MSRLKPRPLTYLQSAIDTLRHRELLEQVEICCLFLGYPRSGGTLLEALLNAHRHAVICHELHALNFFDRGYSERQVYALMLACDRWFAGLERRWSGYDYTVPNQWQGRVERLRVVGDKRGSSTARLLAAKPELLDRLFKTFKHPIRFIHALRNPFDNIATMQRRNPRPLERVADIYFENCRAIQEISGKLAPDQLLVIHHEQVVHDTRGQLQRACAFLGIDAPEDYLRDCASIVNPQPHKSRHKAEWTPELIRSVEERIRQYDFLAGYSFES